MRRHTLLALFAGLGLASAASAADLSIELAGVRSEAGNLMIAVFDSADTFQKDGQEAAAFRVRARARAQRIVLVGLPAGSYAIAVFHDENGNEKLDTNMVGIPTEGNGFSNGAVGNFGPPKFDAAKLVLGASPTHASVTLVY